MSKTQKNTGKKRADEVKGSKLTARVNTKSGTIELDVNSLRKSEKVQAQLIAAEELFERD